MVKALALASYILGAFLIALSPFMFWASSQMFSYAGILEQISTLPSQNFVYPSGSYYLLPGNGWLLEATIKIEPEYGPYKVGQPVFLNSYLTTLQPGQELTVHVFNTESDVNFQTQTTSNLNPDGTVIHNHIPRYTNDRVFNFDLNESSTCDPKLEYTNGISPKGQQCLYDYNGHVKHIFLIPGKYSVDFTFLTHDKIQEHRSQIPVITILDPKDEWAFNSTAQILEETAHIPPENAKSDGYAWLGIGIGLVVSGVSFFLNGLKDLLDIRKTRDFLKEDFEKVNNQQVEIIPKLESILEKLRSDENFIHQFPGQQTKHMQIMIDHLPIMHFSLWTSAASNLKDLDKDEQKRILKIHDDIVKYDRYLQLANDPLVQILSHLSSSSRFEGAELVEIRRSLISTFEYNLSVAKTVYDELQQLKNINWLKSENWKTLETRSREPV